jgi:hypothetical protein
LKYWTKKFIKTLSLEGFTGLRHSDVVKIGRAKHP